jgi:hypothetical protein
MEHSITKTKDRNVSVSIGVASIAGIEIRENCGFRLSSRHLTWESARVIVSRAELLAICKAAGIEVASEVSA